MRLLGRMVGKCSPHTLPPPPVFFCSLRLPQMSYSQVSPEQASAGAAIVFSRFSSSEV
jgi:hypothetical protein